MRESKRNFAKGPVRGQGPDSVCPGASKLLTRDAAGALRADLKSALTEVASGRAGVASLLHQIERVAKYAAGDHGTTLGNPKTQAAMQDLVKNGVSYALDSAGLGGMGWDRLYHEVKEARNDIMHTGTEAVLAETRTKALAAVLLDALLAAAREDGLKQSQGQSPQSAKPLTLAHVMVEHPVCAHLWQTIADVRRTMLISDFSVLPLADNAAGEDRPVWPMLTAEDLAAWLGSDDQRKVKMGKTVEEAKKCGLKVRSVPTKCGSTPVQEVWNACEATRLPVFVTREECVQNDESGRSRSVAHLVGIVTSFDLL